MSPAHLIISEKAQKIIQRKGKTDWREEACFADGNTIYAFEMWRNGIKLSAETERNRKKKMEEVEEKVEKIMVPYSGLELATSKCKKI